MPEDFYLYSVQVLMFPRMISFLAFIGKQLLSAFVPLVLKICNNPGLYSDPALSAAAALALGKFCMVRYDIL